jgi:hypothetical protein
VASNSEAGPDDLRGLAQQLTTFSGNAASLLEAVRAVKAASAAQAPQ